ncbi:MAG: hypothetical protein J6X16_01350 [Bacteroidales bacterium]|nr:hypothetical protein [Bacteroidales bacterium]
MKTTIKSFIIAILCLMAFSVNAQRYAVLDFNAGSGIISQADLNGSYAIFITYFRPTGYTTVERTQIDKVIKEQGFQRSQMTQAQMVRVGKILNVSKIVVGEINFISVSDQYQVYARVINVETGTIAATEGATFATSSFRSSMQSVAQKLASKIAISPGSTVPAQTSSSSTPKTRTSVETLWGYLKIFPMELGTFSSEPTSVISNINAQAQYGYNNWRIPTNEELSLLRANNYLGSGEYMSKEIKRGTVLLVTDGDDYQTVQAKELERQRKIEEERRARIKAEQEQKAKEERLAQLKDEGWIDLGLPSGTLWKIYREGNSSNKRVGLYTYDEAIMKFGNSLPTAEQAKELIDNCKWEDLGYLGGGNKATGPNGNVLKFRKNDDGSTHYKCSDGIYYHNSELTFWTATQDGMDKAKCFKVDSSWMDIYNKLYSHPRCDKHYVWLVIKP